MIKEVDLSRMTTQDQKEVYRESKILEFLKHPNIIRFREVYYRKDGLEPKLCIVMDYADGGDLQNKIKSNKGQPFPEHQIIHWFVQICEAVKYIHSMKVLHRDIKAQNVFLTKEGKCLLGDFGVSRTLNETRGCANTQIGTPFYMSPEIIEGKSYSYESDIWSLGVLLYELCALKVPFNAANIYALSLKIVKGNYAALPMKYSKELRSLVKDMLQANPTKRPTIDQILNMKIMRKYSEKSNGLKTEKALCLIKAREYRLEKEKLLQDIIDNKNKAEDLVKGIACTPIYEPLIKKNIKFEKIRQNLLKKIESKKNLINDYSTANNTEALEYKEENTIPINTSVSAVSDNTTKVVLHTSHTQEIVRFVNVQENRSHSLNVETSTFKELKETECIVNEDNKMESIEKSERELTDIAIITQYLENKFTKANLIQIITAIKILNMNSNYVSIEAYHKGLESYITVKDLYENIGLLITLCQ